jgi:hypothetical protein
MEWLVNNLMKYRHHILIAMLLVALEIGTSPLLASSVQTDLKLRIFSTFIDDEDREVLRKDAHGPWVAYTESRILFALSDGSEYGHGVPFLMILHAHSGRKLMIASEAFLGADFIVKELSANWIIFDVIEWKTQKVVRTVRFKLQYPEDLKAPFIDGVGVEILDPKPAP